MITTEHAALFTDGRYHLQAEKQLDASIWTLMRVGNKDVPSSQEWITKVTLPPPSMRLMYGLGCQEIRKSWSRSYSDDSK